MPRLLPIISLPLAVALLAAWAFAGESVGAVNYVESDPATGSSAAVLVDDLPLTFLPQLIPVDQDGNVIAPGNAAAQAEHLLERLTAKLGPRPLVKLNVYVVQDEDAAHVRPVLAAKFATEARPAVSFVTTRLPHPEALVAMDGIGVAGAEHSMGAWLYVSGQAEPGELPEATRKTLASLSATLAHHGLSDGDVVQLKCFMHPIDRAGEVRRVIDEHFSSLSPVSVSFVEWKSSLPIEIELVAAAGPARSGGQPLEHLPAPGLDDSPLFSRAARVNHGPQIFFSGIYGAPGAPPGEEVEAAFRELARLLDKTGGDMAHLAKATYYVTDDEVSKAHNEVRPRYYRPDRPPAASKAVSAGTGRILHRYTMDMVAVPSSRGTPHSPPEHGHGLAPDEALAGWISLFDGQTTFGWRDARVENGRLSGGTSAARFGPCELLAELDGPGTIKMGKQEIRSSGGEERIAYEGPRAAVELGADTRVKSLVLLPRGLETLLNPAIDDGLNLADWRRINRHEPGNSGFPRWQVEQGVLRVVGGPGAIEYMGREYGDFVAQLVVRTRAVHTNGGFFFRAIPGDFMNGYEAQLHNRAVDDDAAQPYRWATGGIDDRQNARRLASRDFVPFRMTVIADGPHVATWINGVQTVDWTDDRPPHDNPREGLRLRPGVLQIQAHDPATDYELHEVVVAELK